MPVAASVDADVSRIPFARTIITPEAREAAARVLASGWTTTGPEVVEFEREFAAYVGAERALAVSSCTAAIELSLRGLHLPPGSKVLTSTITFCGAVNAIVHAGLQPVLADVDEHTLMPDEGTTAAAARRAGGVDAILAVHLAGQPAPVEAMADAVGLSLDHVVEDAAHGPGTWVGDQPVGVMSAAACFSFYATKNLPIGEGGMITTNDHELADYLSMARLHGMSDDAWRRYLPGSSWRYSVEVDGLKANMTDLHAAIGRAQLQHVPRWQERRAEIARRYDRQLSSVPGIGLPARTERGRHSWHLYIIKVKPGSGLDRDMLIEGLAQRGIGCSVHFIPIHHHPFYRRLLSDQIGDGFPSADAVFPQIVSLPLYPSLPDEDVDRVCSEIASLQVWGIGGASSAEGGGAG